jgi:hypothetical protein
MVDLKTGFLRIFFLNIYRNQTDYNKKKYSDLILCPDIQFNWSHIFLLTLVASQI